METITLPLKEISYPTYAGMEAVRTNAKLFAEQLLKIYGEQRVFLVCKGTSGLTMSVAISVHMDNAVVNYLRKPAERESSHDSNVSRYEGKDVENIPLIVVDDFIATGETLRNIERELRAEYGEYYKGIDCICIREDANRVDRKLSHIESFSTRRYQLLCR